MLNNDVFTYDKQILFLHRYLSEGRFFYAQLRYFEKFFDVFTLDLKGFGKNTFMEYPYSLDDYIYEVKEFCYKNNIVCPNVVAHSFGGRIAIKLASYENDFFDKLVLTGCAGIKPKRKLKYYIKKAVFNILKRVVKKDKLTKFYSKEYQSLSPILKQSFIKITNEHLNDRLKYIKNQTLIINGSLDKETPLYMAKTLHKNIINSKLTIIKDAGHFAFIDKPNIFNYEVHKFLI